MLFFLDCAYLNNYFNFASLCELEGIWLEAEEYLHDPLLVGFDQAAVGWPWVLIFSLFNIDKGCKKPCIIIGGFSLLDEHHIVDSSDNVKLFYVDPELTWLYLSKVEHVLNHELEAEGAWLLDFESIVELADDPEAFFD